MTYSELELEFTFAKKRYTNVHQRTIVTVKLAQTD